jgi:hypothetical protein
MDLDDSQSSVTFYMSLLKVHKNENLFVSNFEFCAISLLVLLKD